MTTPQNNERSALESIEHELYDPRVKINDTEIHRAKMHRSLALPTSWGDDAPIIVPGGDEKGFSFGAKLLVLSVVVLLAALSFSVWRVVSSKNVVSTANIDMDVTVAPYIEGGEPTPLSVTFHNKNTTALESANVTILYKQGSGSQDEQEKVQEKRELGTLLPNESKKQDFSISLYGGEAEARDIALKLEYKVPGANAPFTKVVTTKVILKAAPISVSVEGPGKLSSGQNGSYTILVKNNAATTSLPSVLELMVPNNFTVESISPKSQVRTRSWAVDRLSPGDTTKVVITGSFDGKQGDTGTFVAKVGSVGDSSTDIGIVYTSSVFDVSLRSSPIALTMSLSSLLGAGEMIRYGDRVTLMLTYKNASAQAIEGVSLKLSLTGDAAIYNSIDPTNGYYDSLQKTITWDKASVPDLAVLPPGGEGTLQVTIPIVDRGNNSPALRAVFTGDASTKTSESVTAAMVKTWGVQGSATLDAHTQYKVSPFPNNGPIPPEPNKVTTYTARLTVSAQNTLSDARVSFTLPAYVTWRGIVSDASSVTYDAKTRTVTWLTGAIPQGTSKTNNIGLSVKPSQSHVNQSPVITSGIILDATEEVSQTHLRTTLSPLTTALYNEEWPENPSKVVGK